MTCGSGRFTTNMAFGIEGGDSTMLDGLGESVIIVAAMGTWIDDANPTPAVRAKLAITRWRPGDDEQR